METTATNQGASDVATTLADVHKRLVSIHAALAERPTIDADVRRWTIHELMDVLRAIERVQQ